MDVNRSGYYKWRKRKGKPNRYEQDRILLTQLLAKEHKKYPSHGYHRLADDVFAETGWIFSHNLAHKCCKTAGIHSKARKYRYKKSGEESVKFPNEVKIDKIPAVAPHCDGTVPLNVWIPEKGRCYLKVSYKLKNATEILPEGFDLGFDEILLENVDGRNQTALSIWKTKPQSENSISTTENDRYITISTAAFTYKYDKFTGMFAKMTFEGKEVLDKPMNFNIWRAPTDNDRKLKLHWMAH